MKEGVGDDRPLHSYAAVVAAPVGVLGVCMRDGALAGIDIGLAQRRPVAPVDAATREVVDQLFRYFEDGTWRFELPIDAEGTAFQHRVWRALRGIPAGATRAYGDLARELGTSARAVGGACRRNPVPIVVPCHRVVAGAGPGGFMGERGGAPLAVKEWLLAHERGA